MFCRTVQMEGLESKRTLAMLYGYARVSTTDQDLTIQKEALKAAGCEVIREEKVTGTSRKGRVELDTVLQFIRDGDTLVVTRIDRLARSLDDLQGIVQTLRDKGANLVVTEQSVDTSTASGKAFFQMLGVFAEFETNIRRERQMEGIAKAKAKGVYKGRKRTIDANEVKRLKELGKGATEIANKLKIVRSSVYRALELLGDDPAKR
jgi:DNA invertase Pin-like site-specific DNA recombinase